MDLTGFTDGPPVKVGNSIADLAAGMSAAHGVTLALLARTRTRRGQKVEISMLDVMASLLTYQAGSYFGTGQRPTRRGFDGAHEPGGGCPGFLGRRGRHLVSVVRAADRAGREGGLAVGRGQRGAGARGDEVLVDRFARLVGESRLDEDARRPVGPAQVVLLLRGFLQQACHQTDLM